MLCYLVQSLMLGAIPTVEIAPGVNLPMITMGGVNQPDYPDNTDYGLWLKLGGRGFDSAWEYGTQGTIAGNMSASKIPRSELFLTTKIPGSLHGGCCGCPGAGPAGTCLQKCHGVCFPASGHYTAANATSYIMKDLKTLFDNGVDYIDLLLLHEPCDYLAPYPYNASAETSAVYGAMEAAFRSQDPALKGRIKAIGVSNFDANMLTLLSRTNQVVPAVNQCRMSVGQYDAATHEYCRAHGITYQAYSTLHGDISDPAVDAIAEAHNVSNAQAVMRWITQLGVPLVTASDSEVYDRADLALWDFQLSEKEMDSLTNFKPASKCSAFPTCASVEGQCLTRGCKVCSATPPSKSCGSCGCATCCPGCKLQIAGGLPYCAEDDSH
jgi:2,5-diketo-D-gluconate reductase A